MMHASHGWPWRWTPKLGPRRILRAVDQARAAANILEMRLAELEGLQFPAESTQFIADGQARVAADQQMDELVKTGWIVSYLCGQAYP